MAQDKRQLLFPFIPASGEQEGKKIDSMFKTATWDCAAGKHQVMPNGFCQLCRQQVDHV